MRWRVPFLRVEGRGSMRVLLGMWGLRRGAVEDEVALLGGGGIRSRFSRHGNPFGFSTYRFGEHPRLL